VADVVPLPRRPPGRGELAAAIAAFCDHADLAPTTRRVYRASLAALVDGLGPTRPTPELTAERLEGWFRARYAAAAPATWNRELATLRSAVGWWHANGWPPVAGDPTTGLARRREHPNRTRALTRGQLEALWRRSDLRLRDTALWRLLYETAARTSEALNLDVGDLDLANKRARVAAKGGAVEWVHWQTPTARLLARLVAGRTSGPVFLADPAPTRPVPAGDLDPASGPPAVTRLPGAHQVRDDERAHPALVVAGGGSGERAGRRARPRRHLLEVSAADDVRGRRPRCRSGAQRRLGVV
jgi:hypothetical protein